MSEQKNSKIGLGIATIIGMNAMIGAGIVSIPAILAQVAGPASIASYGISIFLVLFIGLSLGRLAELNPQAGWSYVYPAWWGGHYVGMIAATCYLVGVIIAMGFLVQQAGVWLAAVVPFFTPPILSIIALAVLTVLVLAGATISSIGQYIIVLSVIVPLIVTSSICWLNIRPLSLHELIPYGYGSILSAASLTLFSFLGFESISSLYSVVEDPYKNVPRATVLSILLVGLFYIFFAGGILLSIPLSYFAGGVNQTLARVLYDVFPSYTFLPVLVLIGGLFGIIGTLHSMLWSLSILLMDVLKKVRSKSVVVALERGWFNQSVAVILTALGMLAGALIIRGEDLVNIAVFLIVLTYCLSLIKLLTIRAEWQSGKNIRTLIALFGGSMMVYIASLPLIEIISKIIRYVL